MKQLFFFILFISWPAVAIAQNMVPNPNFALYDACPSSVVQLEKCRFWFNPTITTPDYFNACHDTLPASPHTPGKADQ